MDNGQETIEETHTTKEDAPLEYSEAVTSSTNVHTKTDTDRKNYIANSTQKLSDPIILLLRLHVADPGGATKQPPGHGEETCEIIFQQLRL